MKRIIRTESISTEQAEQDDRIRALINEEYPPSQMPFITDEQHAEHLTEADSFRARGYTITATSTGYKVEQGGKEILAAFVKQYPRAEEREQYARNFLSAAIDVAKTHAGETIKPKPPGGALLFSPAKLGTDLSAEDQREALSSYVHRYTGDHTPAWAKEPRPDGGAYPLQFATDAEWLANTWFKVTAAGRLDHRGKQCQSCATWPNNPELR